MLALSASGRLVPPPAGLADQITEYVIPTPESLPLRKRFPSEQRQVRSAGFTREVAEIFRELFPLYAFSAIEGRAGEQALKRAGRK